MPAKGRKHLGIANRIRGELSSQLHERHDASDGDGGVSGGAKELREKCPPHSYPLLRAALLAVEHLQKLRIKQTNRMRGPL